MFAELHHHQRVACVGQVTIGFDAGGSGFQTVSGGLGNGTGTKGN